MSLCLFCIIIFVCKLQSFVLYFRFHISDITYYLSFFVWLNFTKYNILKDYLLLLLLSHFSRVQLCATPQTAAHKAPPSLGFSRQEHWSGLPFPSPMRESEVAKLCPTLSDPMDCSPPGSSIHGIFQARVLEWGAIKDYLCYCKWQFFIICMDNISCTHTTPYFLIVLGLSCVAWDLPSSLQHVWFFFSCSLRTLSCNTWDLVPWPRIEPRSPASGARSLNCWTTREVPIPHLLKDQNSNSKRYMHPNVHSSNI